MSNEEKSGLKHWVPAFVLMVCSTGIFRQDQYCGFIFRPTFSKLDGNC